MNKFPIWLCAFIVCSLAVAAEPVVLFSDLTAAPNVGWSDAEPNKGAAVTIWGNGFGDVRGSSYVTVNGVDLTSDSDYAVWGEYWPTQYYQRITFWLNSAMSNGAGAITVTVNGETSNPLDFTIQDGRIKFVDLTTPTGNGEGTLENPYLYGNHFLQWGGLRYDLGGGDIMYFREGTYGQISSQGAYILRFDRDGVPRSSPDNMFALLAYPGEKPRFESTTTEGGIGITSYMVVSGLTIDNIETAISGGGEHLRIVGNDAIGVQRRSGQGTGIITSGNNGAGLGSQNHILGNAVHGGRGGYRLDHGIYVSGCSTDGGQIVAWNHLYDNDWGRGPIISINSMDDKRLRIRNLDTSEDPKGEVVAHYHRCKNNTVGRPFWPPQFDVPEDQIMDAHFVFNNRVECYPQRATAINVWQLSYKEGEEEPEPTYVYNNIFEGCGTFDMEDRNDVGWAISSAHQNGHAHFYNNVWYDTGYVGIQFGGGPNRLSTTLKNNIFHMNKDVQSGRPTNYLSFSNSGNNDWSTVTFENNIVYGASTPFTGCSQCGSDKDNNETDPMFVDPENGDFRLQPGSPAIDAGQAVSFEIQPPAWANIARDRDFSTRDAVDIGAHEFGSSFVPPPIVRPDPREEESEETGPETPPHSEEPEEREEQEEVEPTPPKQGKRKWKDFNNDGKIDRKDLRAMAKKVVRKKATEEYDLNEDGVVNIYDLIRLIEEFDR